MPVSITFEHVSKQFGDTRAVDDVSLQIEPGELFFLLGPSGCGKTTLLRCVAGFHAPDAGTIRLGDREITRLPPHVRDTGMVFQSYALWPHLTVGQNVSFGLEMRRVGRAEIDRRVAEVLDLVRMRDRAGDKPNALSGGQQQRVALARALVVRPQCLLLDEPLSNLDAQLRLDMRGEIRRICKDAGLTAIYVTHDQKEALSVADRLAVMRAGRLQQVGAPREVYLRPASAFVAGFVGETNLLAAEVAELSGRRVRLRTALGMLEGVPPAGALSVGAKVTLSIRPEVIRFDAPPSGIANVLAGMVHDTMYLGEVAQHQVRIDARDGGGEDAHWKAVDLNPRLLARDKPELARLWIAPEDVVILTQ